MTTKSTPIEAQALIPAYWELIANSMDDIVFLGQVTVRGMVRYWRGQANSCSEQIKRAEERITFLEGKTIADLQQAALEYELPVFTKIGVLADNWSDTPEPLDGNSINRRRPATTFNVCGWCQYCGGGSGRYGYMITTSCSLLTEVGIENWEKDERAFNSLCFIRFADDAVLDRLRVGLAAKKEEYVANKKEVDRKIRLLLKLEKRAEKKPALPDHRPHDWFNLGDPLTCYVGGWKDRIVPDTFATAKVIDGYRHHDGGVSVEYTKRLHNGEYLEGYGGSYGMSRPEVMHAWEFEYLLDHPEFAAVWTGPGTSKHLCDYSRDKFLAAFAHEACLRSGKIVGDPATEGRMFHLGDILSITTDRLVSPRRMEGVYDILNFMTGDDLFTHQLPRASEECKPYLALQFPQFSEEAMAGPTQKLTFLLGLSDDLELSNPKSMATIVDEWLAELVAEYGEQFEVHPVPAYAHTHIGPIEEACDIMGAENVYVVGSEDNPEE